MPDVTDDVSKDEAKDRAKDATARVAARVTVTSPDGTHQTEHLLRGDEHVTVGRAVPGHTPTISLQPDAQSWVSRLHCRLERVEGSWSVVDDGSANGTLVERKGQRNLVRGRYRLQDRDEILILGHLVSDEPYWWRLRFHDPFTTLGAARATAVSTGPTGPRLEYRFDQAKLFLVVEDGTRREVRLGPIRHKLVRYMANRNTSNNGVPVTCTHDELITAVWGRSEEWDLGKSYTRQNLTDLVHELRKQLDPYEDLVETVTGIGYSLRTGG